MEEVLNGDWDGTEEGTNETFQMLFKSNGSVRFFQFPGHGNPFSDSFSGLYKVDTTKEPNTIDITLEEPFKYHGKVVLGLVQVSVDPVVTTMKLAFCIPTAHIRPHSFDHSKDKKVRAFRFSKLDPLKKSKE